MNGPQPGQTRPEESAHFMNAQVPQLLTVIVVNNKAAENEEYVHAEIAAGYDWTEQMCCARIARLQQSSHVINDNPSGRYGADTRKRADLRPRSRPMN